jgi:O-antigen/teichoic acid export membrane protein
VKSAKRPFLRQVVVNTASSGLANVWAMVATAIALPMMLGGLGQEGFGTWVLLQTFSATNGWLSLADLGVVISTTRAVADRVSLDDGETARRVASSSLLVCTTLGLISAVLLATLGPWLLPELFRTPDGLVRPLQVATVVFSIQIVFDLALNSFEGILEGLNRVDLSRGVDIARRALVVLSAAAAAMITGDIVAAAVTSMLATAVATFVGFMVVRAHLPRFLVRPDRDQVRTLLQYGRSLALLRPLGVLQRTMDRLIVGIVLGPAAVPYVEIATQLQAAADAVSSAVSYSVVPASSWLKAREDDHTLGQFAELGTKYALLAVMPIVLGVALLSTPIIEVWLGPTYLEAAGLTVVAVINVGLTAPLVVGSQMLVGLGRASSVLRAVVPAVTVNVIASLILIHAVGIVGVFIATILGSFVLIRVLGRAFLREVDISAKEFVTQSVLPSVGPSLAMASVVAAVLVLGLSPLSTILVGGASGVLVYGIVAGFVSSNQDELAVFRSALRRRAGR